MKAVILAGGLGTRLRPVIGPLPKPLAEVAGRPFLEYLVLHLRGSGITEIILATGYRGDLIRSYFGNGASWGVAITYAEERELLGTGGAVKAAMHVAGDDDVVVFNGDTFFAIDLARLAVMHRDRCATATLALAEDKDSSRYGRVIVDPLTGAVIEFREKGRNGGGLINGGVYVLNRRILDRIPDGVVSLEREVFPCIVGRGIYGMPYSGYFIDIGVPDMFEQLCRDPAALLRNIRRADL